MTEEYYRFSQGAGSWIFAGVCVAIAAVLMRLILRERITLQGSMSYLAFVFILGLMTVFPDIAGELAYAVGFSSFANFFFCTAIALLAILHLRALVTRSRVHLRSIALTQELAIMQEKLDRAVAQMDARKQ